MIWPWAARQNRWHDPMQVHTSQPVLYDACGLFPTAPGAFYASPSQPLETEAQPIISFCMRLVLPDAIKAVYIL
jgi:hypothetical protein